MLHDDEAPYLPSFGGSAGLPRYRSVRAQIAIEHRKPERVLIEREQIVMRKQLLTSVHMRFHSLPEIGVDFIAVWPFRYLDLLDDSAVTVRRLAKSVALGACSAMTLPARGRRGP